MITTQLLVLGRAEGCALLGLGLRPLDFDEKASRLHGLRGRLGACGHILLHPAKLGSGVRRGTKGIDAAAASIGSA